jgi:hypothetical protein
MLYAARALYLKNGFIDIPRYNDNYSTDVFMEKGLLSSYRHGKFGIPLLESKLSLKSTHRRIYGEYNLDIFA